ncbi:MAG: GreA/GreB family elongation factor [Oligoflexales bacterium]|nr:GreA/GreB family elongation factor [Oligoflexales bacterium]
MKKLLTRQGFNKIAEEHRQLLTEVRPKVVEGIAIAAAEGDRSENAEYIYGRKRLREIDKRLKYLTELMKDTEIVDPASVRGSSVCFASTAVVVDEEGNQREWTIVGIGEADAENGTISYKSPMAAALMGKKIGDIVNVRKPSGTVELEIVDIKFNNRSIQGQC